MTDLLVLDAQPCICAARPARRCRADAQRGAAAVEFALVLPVLLAVLMGVVEMGLALYDKAVLTHASREGARAGIVLRNPKLSTSEISAIVLQRTQASLISLMPANPPQVTVLQSSPAAYPNTLQVTVQYTFQGIALGSLMQAMGTPWVIRATTVMVHE
jgi:Flp pilus assembly protein TadG